MATSWFLELSQSDFCGSLQLPEGTLTVQSCLSSFGPGPGHHPLASSWPWSPSASLFAEGLGIHLFYLRVVPAQDLLRRSFPASLLLRTLGSDVNRFPCYTRTVRHTATVRGSHNEFQNLCISFYAQLLNSWMQELDNTYLSGQWSHLFMSFY